MLRFSSLIKYNYTIEPVLNLRKTTSLKVCFRRELEFLKVKNSLTQSIANRLVINSDFYRSYKDLRFCYINLLRYTLINPLIKYDVHNFSHFDKKDFIIHLQKTGMNMDLDYILTAKANQVNSLFNLATKITKKRKKVTYSHRAFYLKPEKRLLFVWKWLAVFIRSLQVKGTPRCLSLTNGLENFLMAPENSHTITKFKHKIYKLYLLRIT